MAPTVSVDCAVCATPLIYATHAETRVCTVCGREQETLIWCPRGHFVCDACHAKTALEVLASVVADTRTTDAGALLERAMAHSSVCLHGPEHHAIVPAVIVAATRNALARDQGDPSRRRVVLADDAVEQAIARGRQVPGGSCGYHGACGAAIGAGTAVSVITAATPLTGEQRSLALAATAAALSAMLNDEPRCCKRESRTAVEAAVEFLRERLDVPLAQPSRAPCAYSTRCAQCARERCRYFGDH